MVRAQAGEPQKVETPVLKSESVRVARLTRRYRIVLPPSRTTGAPHALVVAFHGFGDNKDLMPVYSGLDDLARNHGAIVVYPQSRPGAWPLLLDWAKPDIAFFDALIESVDRRHGVDRSRIFVTGMSNGGYFANLLASQRSTIIAAIAVHSGGLGAVNLIESPFPRKYPVMIVHGSADAIVRIAEGRRQKSFYESRGHEVRYVELPGWNHFWARKLGINEQIWDFFAQHPVGP